MTTTNPAPSLIKVDCLGRVRTTPEYREALVAAYEGSALSGPEFCKLHGINYGSPSGLLDGLSSHLEEQVAKVGHSACPVDESCNLVVEALDLARGDAVFGCISGQVLHRNISPAKTCR